MGSKGFENSCYNTEDGISLSLPNLLGAYRLIFMSIGSDMCKLNCLSHDLFATKFLLRLFIGLRPQTSQTATHAIDFGPGGLSGIDGKEP